jgi:hypothetical protein
MRVAPAFCVSDPLIAGHIAATLHSGLFFEKCVDQKLCLEICKLNHFNDSIKQITRISYNQTTYLLVLNDKRLGRQLDNLSIIKLVLSDTLGPY